MADSHDEVDDLLRGAMKVLDGEVPSGYFEALPNRTLSRLEGNGMHTQSSGIDNVDDTNPVMMQDMTTSASDELDRAPTTTDDSGLHDIRSLASSTKARLSKRFTAPVVEEDVLASSSAGWKAVALPEPAKMISLPELSELPNLAEQPKRSKRESRRELAAAAAAAPVAPAVGDELAARRAEGQAAPATSLSTMPAFGSGMLAKAQPKKSKRGLLATASVGLAAAAGVLIYTQTAGKQSPEVAPAKSEPAIAEQQVEAAKTPEPTATGAAIAADVDSAAAPAAAEPAAPPPVEEKVADDKADERDDRDKRRAAKKPGKPAHEIDLSKGQKIAPKKAEDPKKPAPAAGSGAKEEAVGSLDDLLKEAGVSEKKKDKPKLEKKSLSASDIRKGMQSVSGKAQACYAGTQGTASVKLTVAPSGQVQKVTVTGVFAGTPVAACVASAVKGITFPAWDGGPQSINYSYLLAE